MSETDYNKFDGEFDNFDKDEQEREENGDYKNSIPIVYVIGGEFVVKFAVNPKTPQLLFRQGMRHNFQGVKTPCLSDYGIDCPVDKVVYERGDILSDDELMKIRRRYFWLIYAKLYKITDKKNKKHEGKFVCLMYPRKMQTELSKLVKGIGGSRAVFSPEGHKVKIINNQGDYELNMMSEEVDLTEELETTKLKDLKKMIYPADKVTDRIIGKVSKLASDLSDYIDNIGDGQSSSHDSEDAPEDDFDHQDDTPAEESKEEAKEETSVEIDTQENEPKDDFDEPFPETDPPFEEDKKEKRDGVPECFGEYKESADKCMDCVWEMECHKETTTRNSDKQKTMDNDEKEQKDPKKSEESDDL